MTVHVHEAESADARSWDTYVATREAPPSSNWAWRGILADAYGAETIYLKARNDAGATTGQLALFTVRDWRRRLHIYSLRHGFLADDGETARQLGLAAADIAHRRGAVSLIVTSGRAAFELDCRRWTRSSIALPLKGDVEPMWKGLRDKVRNMVRKAERNGLVCVQGAQYLRQFYDCYAERLGARSVPLHSRRLFECMIERPDAVLYSALRNGRPVGGMVFQHGATVASYFQSSFQHAAASLGVGQFLMWQAVKDSISRGATAIDMGESAPGSGVHAFKTLFGGKAETIHYYNLLRPAARHASVAGADAGRPSAAMRLLRRLPLAARIPLLRLQRRLGRLV